MYFQFQQEVKAKLNDGPPPPPSPPGGSTQGAFQSFSSELKKPLTWEANRLKTTQSSPVAQTEPSPTITNIIVYIFFQLSSIQFIDSVHTSLVQKVSVQAPTATESEF